MVDHLHTGFLENTENYQKAVEYWRRLCCDILADLGQRDKWHPFFESHRVGLERAPEEGAIWTFYSDTMKKAVVIEQFPASSDEMVLYARLDTFGASYLPEPLIMLIVSCELSVQAANLARKLIAAWADKETSADDMNRLIRRLLG